MVWEAGVRRRLRPGQHRRYGEEAGALAPSLGRADPAPVCARAVDRFADADRERTDRHHTGGRSLMRSHFAWLATGEVTNHNSRCKEDPCNPRPAS